MKKKEERYSGNLIVPYNPKKYDLEKALSLFPYLEWTQHARPEVGGSVYLYIGKTGGKTNGQQLAYEFEVLAINAEATIDDSCCMLVPGTFSNKGKFFRMKFLRRIPSQTITLQDLLDHGLKKYPQSQTKVPFGLQAYIDSVLD